MKKSILILVTMVIFSPLMWGQSEGERFEFLFGETIHFKITWFKIHAGFGSMSINLKEEQGEKFIVFKGMVRSAKWFSKVYYVEDHIETIVRYDDLLPIKIKIDFKEGKKYRKICDYDFDYENKQIISDGKTKEFPTEEQFTEMFSAFFLLRIFDFDQNTEIKKMVTDGRKFYKVSAIKTGVKKMSGPLGRRECIVIKPKHVRLQLFGEAQKPSDINMYVTNDEEKLPYLIAGKIKIGKLKAKMTRREKK